MFRTRKMRGIFSFTIQFLIYFSYLVGRKSFVKKILQYLFGWWLFCVASTILKKRRKNISISKDEGFLAQGGGKEKSNSLYFSFMSYHKQIWFFITPPFKQRKGILILHFSHIQTKNMKMDEVFSRLCLFPCPKHVINFTDHPLP